MLLIIKVSVPCEMFTTSSVFYFFVSGMFMFSWWGDTNKIMFCVSGRSIFFRKSVLFLLWVGIIPKYYFNVPTVSWICIMFRDDKHKREIIADCFVSTVILSHMHFSASSISHLVSDYIASSCELNILFPNFVSVSAEFILKSTWLIFNLHEKV